MCRYGTKPFAPAIAQTRAARYWVSETLRRWDLAGLIEELELAGSELVTNALLHTRSGFDVSLAVGGGFVELAVRDRDPREPVLRPPRLDLLADVDSLHQAELLSGDDHADEARHPSLHVGPAGSIAAGRGLIIIDAIADEWGVASHSGGKDVWLRVPVPSEWPYLEDCTCDESSPRTSSGRPVRHSAGPWDATD